MEINTLIAALQREADAGWHEDVGALFREAAEQIEALRDDRDSWRDQASARVADAVDFAAQADALRADAFALRALVAAGHVSQALVNRARTLPGAPSFEAGG